MKIQNCTFIGTGVASTPAIQIGTGTAPFDGIKIYNNTISGFNGTSSNAILFNIDNGHTDSGTVTIEKNTVTDFGHNGIQFVLATADLVIKDNVFTCTKTDKEVLNLSKAKSTTLTGNTFTVPENYSEDDLIVWNNNAGAIVDATNNTFFKGEVELDSIDTLVPHIGGYASNKAFVGYGIAKNDSRKINGGYLCSFGEATEFPTDLIAEGYEAVSYKEDNGIYVYQIQEKQTKDWEVIDAQKLVNIYTADGLFAFAESTVVDRAEKYSGYEIHIKDDIDLTGRNWKAISMWKAENGFTFDGEDHTITGLGVPEALTDRDNPHNYGAGLFTDVRGELNPVVIKNITFDSATVGVENGSKVAIIVGHAYNDITIENVTISNSKLVSTTKMGAFIGLHEGNNKGLANFINCKLVNTTVEGEYSFALMIGLEQNSDGIQFTNCSADENSTTILAKEFPTFPGCEHVTIEGYVYAIDGGGLWLLDPNGAWAEQRTNQKCTYNGTEYTVFGGKFYYADKVVTIPEVYPEAATVVDVDVPTEASAINLTESTVEQKDVEKVQTEVKTLLEQTGTQNETADTKKSLEDALKATVENNATALVDVLKEAALEQGLGEDVIGAIADNAITEKKLEIKFNKVEVKEVEEEKATLNSISYNVTPVVVARVGDEEITTEIHELEAPITFRLAVNFAENTDVLVFDDGKLLEGEHKVQKDANGNYVVLSSKTFSTYEIVDATETPKTDAFKFKSASLTVADALDLKFTVVANGYDEVVVKAFVGGKEQTCEQDENNKYIVEVSPEYINDDVQLQLYGTKDDKRYCTTYSYSVEKYCNNQLKKFTDGENGGVETDPYYIYSKPELEEKGILYYEEHDDDYSGEGIVVHPNDVASNAAATALDAMTYGVGFWGSYYYTYDAALKELEEQLKNKVDNPTLSWSVPGDAIAQYRAAYEKYYLPNEKNIALKALLTNILEYGKVAKDKTQECKTKYSEEFYESRGKYIGDVKAGADVVEVIINSQKLYKDSVKAQIVLSDKIDVEMTFDLAYAANLTKVSATYETVKNHTKDDGTPKGIIWTADGKIDPDPYAAFTMASVKESNENKTYTVRFDGLNATEIDDVINYTFDFNDGSNSTVKVSVYSLLDKFSGTDYENIATAAQNYGLAADYYAYILTVDKNER